MKMDSISTEKFYGNRMQMRKKFKFRSSWIKTHRVMPSHILGPTQYWKEFHKQADTLVAAVENSTKTDMLCTFVYQRPSDGSRKFIVAHPEVYWWYYKVKPPEEKWKCHFTEKQLIPQNSPCWLYLDLEYLIELNPLCNGSRMTKTLIDIIRAYLLHHYHLLCDRSNFLILDSTSSTKFSRHVIFTIKDMAFRDNLHVGRLIKTICNDITLYLNSDTQKHGILDHFAKTDLEELLVETNQNKKLFVDTGVYTKNRQFRIYLATKWGKQSYLTVSPDCTHTPVNKCKDKELGIFLDSLISYFPNKQNLVLLEFFNRSDVKAKLFSKISSTQSIKKDDNTSPYPDVDKYIRDLITPGKIRVVRYSNKDNTLKYEIYGNRYCENIGRSHKSNNVYWIVDLNRKELYQKCHDADCSSFVSAPKSLPDEIVFQLDTEGDDLVSNTVIDENVV